MSISTKTITSCLCFLAATHLVACSAGRTQKSAKAGRTNAIKSDAASTTTRLAEASIRDYMDIQAHALGTVEEARVERNGNEIHLVWDSAVLYDFDSAMLKRQSQTSVKSMADILIEFSETYIVIAAHTDSVGVDAYNQKLSARQALSVRNFLIDLGVEPARIETIGYGETRPAASNNTEEGRRQNQRVEITIRPNEALQARATDE